MLSTSNSTPDKDYVDSSLIPQSTLPQITEVIGLSFTWTEYKKLNQMKKARTDGRAMYKLYTDILDLSSNRRKWLEDPTKHQFEKELDRVQEIAWTANTLLICHFSGHGFNNCTAEACFGDNEIVSLQDAMSHLSSRCPKLWIVTLFDAC